MSNKKLVVCGSVATGFFGAASFGLPRAMETVSVGTTEAGFGAVGGLVAIFFFYMFIGFVLFSLIAGGVNRWRLPESND